ncbi:MAG: hypothetical protein Q7T70_12170 [Polaromonas sp.]|nr:hypothetical protein [Polaromonas sp.]
MKLGRPALLATLALLGTGFALSQTSTPTPGSYVINDGAWGTLQIGPQGKFQIETVGPNAHICGLDGVMTDGKSKLKGSNCEVQFSLEGQDVRVTPRPPEACKEFCGMRAWFEGVYKKPPPPCTRQSIAQARKKFKKEYVAKSYSEALSTLSPVVTQCQDFLHKVDWAWVLNDLALTQLRLGDSKACIRTLQSLAADAALSDEAIMQKYPPADADAYVPVMGATRTNLKLCSRR